jgi:hypothetical protein
MRTMPKSTMMAMVTIMDQMPVSGPRVPTMQVWSRASTGDDHAPNERAAR